MNKQYIKYFLALMLFGSNGVVASYIALSSYEIVLTRSFFGSLLLIALYFITGNRLNIFKHKRDMCFIIFSGIAMAVDWLLLFEAYKQIGVSLGMIINYCGPVIVMGLSVFIFKERLNLIKVTALASALIGVIFISQQAVGSVTVMGLICAVLSAFAYSAMIIFNKLAKEIKGMENATLQLFSAFLTIALFVALKGGLNVHIPSGDWLPVLWLGLINTGLSCYLYFSSVSVLPVGTVAICGYLEPLSAVILSFIMLGEKMTLLQVIGGGLIIGGAILGETKGKTV